MDLSLSLSIYIYIYYLLDEQLKGIDHYSIIFMCIYSMYRFANGSLYIYIYIYTHKGLSMFGGGLWISSLFFFCHASSSALQDRLQSPCAGPLKWQCVPMKLERKTWDDIEFQLCNMTKSISMIL